MALLTLAFGCAAPDDDDDDATTESAATTSSGPCSPPEPARWALTTGLGTSALGTPFYVSPSSPRKLLVSLDDTILAGHPTLRVTAYRGRDVMELDAVYRCSSALNARESKTVTCGEGTPNAQGTGCSTRVGARRTNEGLAMTVDCSVLGRAYDTGVLELTILGTGSDTGCDAVAVKVEVR